MNLSTKDSTDIRSPRARRLAVIGLVGGCALSLVMAACSRSEKSAGDTATVAAAPAAAPTPTDTARAPAAPAAPADSGLTTSAAGGEATPPARERPSTHADTGKTAPRAATTHAAATSRARHADSATTAKKAPSTAVSPATKESTTTQPTTQPAAKQPAPARDSAAGDSAKARTTAAAAPAADSSCATENGDKGVQPAKPGPDPLLVNQSEYDGWKMFHVYCYRCHGVDAMGGGIAPNLRHSLGPDGSVDHACFIKTVTDGRLAKGMPSWKQLLDPDQIENIWHYLQARSSGRLAPGRPHTASKG
ncbi:MAG TPA: c-type cytochrome [Gemmatimonadaceae bacterium]